MANHWEIVNSGGIKVSNTPEELWKNACEYFMWSDNNPIKVKRAIMAGSRAGTDIETERTRPYSIKALCLHCGIQEEYLRDIRNTKEKSSMYYIVVSKILYIIYVQAYEMATIGEFNPIFTAKILNLDKDDVPPSSIKIEIVQGLPALSNSENDILEMIEKEMPNL